MKNNHINSSISKVAIYARVSTQDKQEYDRQVNDLTKVITEYEGYLASSIEIFAEKISGYKKVEERIQLKQLEDKVVSNPKYFDCIYVTEISRLGRDPIQIRNFIDRFSELKVPIYIQSIKQKTLSSDGSRNSIMNIIIQVLLEFANSEAETTKQRSKSGLLQSAKNGNAGGGKFLPYGYTKDGAKKLVICEEESKVIEDIFEWYSKGDGIKAISNKLNLKRVPTRTNKAFAGKTIKFGIEKMADMVEWSDKQVHDILRNPIYIGQRRYKGNLLQAPSIVKEELFNTCNALMQSKTHRNYLTSYTYLLKDISVCGCCGRNYFAKYKPVKGGDKVYICSSRLKKGGNCGNIGFNIGLVESVLYDLIIETDAIHEYINQGKDGIKQLESELNRLLGQIDIDERLLIKRSSELDRLLELRLSDSITLDRYNQKYSEIQSDIKSNKIRLSNAKVSIESTRDALKNQGNAAATVKMLRKAKLNRSELQVVFKQIFSKVIFNVLDKDTGLLSVFITLDGVKLVNILKVFLNLNGIKSKIKKYEYFTLVKMVEDVAFVNNVLTVDISDIKKEFLSKMKYSKWTVVKTKNYVEIDSFQKK
jgi:DNA invertase Pin-like site-specific DNA recombinase